MLSFKDFIQDEDCKEQSSLQVLSESSINNHSTHLEDLIFTRGKQGLYDALEAVDFIIDSIGKQTVNKAVSTKIDGCVRGDTLVLTTHGLVKISELTNNDLVASYNINEKRIEFGANSIPRITGIKKKDWVRVEINRPNNYIYTTVDHPFLMASEKYTEAQKLNRRSVLFDVDKKHNKGILSVTKIKERYEHWDLTTPNMNFVVSVGGILLVVHNSPAIFMINGEKGFGVATKSIFNKNPKINYSVTDIMSNHSGDLTTTLKSALNNLKDIIPNTKNRVYQGDLLFTESSKKFFEKDGEKYIGFHPNTILYSVLEDSETGKEIKKADIGIAVHTEYSWDGIDPSTLKVEKYGISKDVFRESSKVFLIDTVSNLSDKNHKIPFTLEQFKQLNELIENTKKLGSKIDWDILTEDSGKNLKVFVNSYIRKNIDFPSSSEMYDNFLDWIEEMSKKDEESKKTDKGKQRARERYNPLRELFVNRDTLIKLFEVFKNLTEIKNTIIDKLSQLSTYHNFIVKSNGDMVVAGEEGFVMTQTNARGVKLVDRLKFSSNNFSADIIKGWSKGQ